MGKLYGFNGKAYLSGTASAPTAIANVAGIASGPWLEMDSVVAVTVTCDGDDKDVTDRAAAAGGFKSHDVIINDASVTLKFFNDSSDVVLGALRTAKFAGAEIGMAFMDGDISTAGSNGLAGNWKIKNYSRGEPIEDMQTVDLTIVPGPSGVMSDYTKGS